MGNDLLIDTSLGTTVLDPVSIAYVQISGGKFVEKQVSEIIPGDRVLFGKSAIDKKIEDIEDIMFNSRIYREAVETIFWRNPNVPHFRHDLIVSLGPEAGITGDLETKLLESDLDSKDYRSLIDPIKNVLSEDGFNYDASTIKRWLTGETVAPQNWDVFNVLAKEYDIFEKYNQTSEGLTFRDQYEIYVNVRQRTMKYLKNKSSIDSSNSSKKNSEVFPLGSRVDSAIAEFMGDISDNFVAAEVKMITTFDEPNHFNGKRLPRSGVVVSKPQDARVEILDYHTVYEHYLIMSQALIKTLRKDFSKNKHPFTKLEKNKNFPDANNVNSPSETAFFGLLYLNSSSRYSYQKFEELKCRIGFDPTDVLYHFQKQFQNHTQHNAGISLEHVGNSLFQTVIRLYSSLPPGVFEAAQNGTQKQIEGVKNKYGVDLGNVRVNRSDSGIKDQSYRRYIRAIPRLARAVLGTRSENAYSLSEISKVFVDYGFTKSQSKRLAFRTII